MNNLTNIPEICRELIKQNIDKMKHNLISSIYEHEKLTIYFLMSKDCNGGCKYCYQPKSFRKTINMSREVITKSIDFILDTFQETNISFCFFGGEPTLNWKEIEEVLNNYSALQFHMMTNGILIYENENIRDIIKKHRYHFDISISLEPLRRYLGAEAFLEKAQVIFKLLKETNNDANIVISDPTENWILPTFKYLLDFGIPKVRVSILRQSSKVIDMEEEFVSLFKQMADYTYFRDNIEPIFGRTATDVGFGLNIFRKLSGRPYKILPPTMCGCGQRYLTIDEKGDIYPCDWFSNFPEFKIGDIYNGLIDTARFFYETNHWLDGLYEDCKTCPITELVKDFDVRLCTRAMCLAENYQNNGNPLKPTKLHCQVNKIEYRVYDYVIKEVIKRGYDKKYNLAEMII